ncbi:uncharacterized protein LOC141912135 [Tubulanus polymorphus]|uniref:uncharacterized protein LOC141912135 n=1 Tax=Tubulanus polymorphus TaxID=672921 RepID=UPI003DA26900
MASKHQEFLQTLPVADQAWVNQQVLLAQQQGAAQNDADKQCCMTRDPVKYRRAHTILGIMQIVIGVVFMIVAPILGAKTSLGKMAFSFGMSALWFILAGSFGIGGRNKRRCALITCMVFCVFAAIACACVMASCGSGMRKIMHGGKYDWKNDDHHRHHHDGPPKRIAAPPRDQFGGKFDDDDRKPPMSKDLDWGKRRCSRVYIGLYGTLTFLAMVEFIVAIVQAVYCCKVTCCGRTRVTQAPVIIYMNGAPPVGDYQQRKPSAPNVYPILGPVQPPAYTEKEDAEKKEVVYDDTEASAGGIV